MFFCGAGWESRTLISTSAKSHISRYVKPAISSKHSWLLRTCCCYNKEYSIIVAGAPNGSRNRIYSFGPRIKTWAWISKIVFYIKLFWGKAVTLTFVLSVQNLDAKFTLFFTAFKIQNFGGAPRSRTQRLDRSCAASYLSCSLGHATHLHCLRQF